MVSLPFVLTVGALFAIGGLGYSFYRRSNDAFAAGQTDRTGSAALAALGDVVGATNIVEGYTGEDVVTDRQLGGQERSERQGTGIGTGVATLAGGRSFRAGAGVAPKAVALAGWDPYTVPSISRPTLGNPLVTGEYRTPNGMLLRSNMLRYRKKVGGKTITVYPLREGARNWWRSGSASEAYYTTLEESKGNFGHVFRHFVDNPNRVSPWTGNPQIHSCLLYTSPSPRD